MPFVKLDCGILDSSLWIDQDARTVFITALLMAEPFELLAPAAQLEIESLDGTGWDVPPGWYGKVNAAGGGIILRAGVENEKGVQALKKLGSPDKQSRSDAFDGRRLVRVDGGFLVLNFIKYRDLDYTNAERQARWRERQKTKRNAVTDVTKRYVTPLHNTKVTQAEAEAEAEEKKKVVFSSSGKGLSEKQTAPESNNAVESLHAIYVRMTALEVVLNMPRIAAWEKWKAQGWTDSDLCLVIGAIKKGIKKQERRPAALKFRNLVEDISHFEEQLAEARAKERVVTVPKERAVVLRATGRDDRPPTQPFRPVSEVALKILRDFRAQNV
jgi:hypothetical protein